MLPGSWKTIFQNHKGRACWVMLSQHIHDFWNFKDFKWFFLRWFFFSKHCPSQYLRFAGVVSPETSLQFFVGGPRRSDVKVLPDHASWKPKKLKKWWVFFSWKKIPEDDSWGMKCSFLLLNWEVKKFGPWMVVFFVSMTVGKKSMQNLKELHDWLLQIFINGHFNFCSKSWMFFSFRVPGMNRMVPSEESQTYMWFKTISACFNDIGRLPTCLGILNGWSKKMVQI